MKREHPRDIYSQYTRELSDIAALKGPTPFASPSTEPSARAEALRSPSMWKLAAKPRRSPRARVAGETALSAAPKRLRRNAVEEGEEAKQLLKEAVKAASTTQGAEPVASTSRNRMPAPVEDLLESPADLALDAAFADKRAMLELSGYAARGHFRGPSMGFWSRRSASRQAEPFPLGFDGDNPSTTSGMPTESDPHLARYLGVPMPAQQSLTIGAFDPSLPAEAQDYLANQEPFSRPSSQPVASTSRAAQDLASIAPFGLAGQPPATRLSRPPLHPLGELQTKLLFSQHTLALWRAGLRNLRSSGKLTPERLRKLVATAEEVNEKGKDKVVMAFSAPVDLQEVDVEAFGRFSEQGEQASEQDRQKAQEIHAEIVKQLEHAFRSSSGFGDLFKSLLESNTPIMTVRIIDGSRVETIERRLDLNGESSQSISTSSLNDMHAAFLDARRMLLDQHADIVESLGPLDPVTLFPSWTVPEAEQGRLRHEARLLKYRLLFLYGKHEALARAELEGDKLDGPSRAALERLVERASLRLPTAEDERRLQDAIGRTNAVSLDDPAKDFEHRSDDALAARLMRANFSAVVSLRDQRAQQKANGGVQMLSTIDWRRHKHKKQRKKKTQKRNQSDKEVVDRRARRERMRQFEENKGDNSK